MQNITPSVIFLYKFSTHEKIGIRSLKSRGKILVEGKKNEKKNRLPCNECPLQ